ncbi:MAG: hypothetical protein GY930_10220 [bacterium]|nr:hypothetical protein [bacterium]
MTRFVVAAGGLHFSLAIVVAIQSVQSSGFGLPANGVEGQDWVRIQDAHESSMHRVSDNQFGFEARNPGQGWSTHFDGQGFRVVPDEGAWTWGLQLRSLGFDRAMPTISGCAKVEVVDNRVTYEWSSGLSEWYINGVGGLEHGFTLHSRPGKRSDQKDLLCIELSVLGSLLVEVLPGSGAVAFVNADGQSVLTYSGLRVFDSTGKDCPATLAGSGSSLRILIDESQASYPLTVDPVAQQAYLKASNTGSNDRFGCSVAISGSLAVVGARHEDSASAGVNGDDSDNSLFDSGAAYVFRKTGGVWAQEAYLKASTPGHSDQFGYSVAVSGDRVVVGAHLEDSNSTGVDGDETNDLAPDSGAVYVFRRIAGVWGQETYIKASNTGGMDYFGHSVAISGGGLVVGADGEDSNATIVNGNGGNDFAPNSGAAYVFWNSGGGWGQEAYIKSFNTDAADALGSSVAISGDRVAVGARGEDSSAMGVDGDHFNNGAGASGAVYVYKRVLGNWSHEAYLKASNTGTSDLFGASISMSGFALVVGASGEDSDSTGVNGDGMNNFALDSGAGFVFRRSGVSWVQEAYLKASNTGSSDHFGGFVSLDGDRVVIGAHQEASGSTGVDGDGSDDSASGAGAAYLFQGTAGTWNQLAYLKASNTDAGDQFGFSVGVSGNSVIVGAMSEDSTSSGVNGDEDINFWFQSGASYTFSIGPEITNYCNPTSPNSAGSFAFISDTGSPFVAVNDFGLHVGGLPPGVFGYFLNSPGQGFVANPGGSQGNLCLGGGLSIGRHLLSLQDSGVAGVMDYALDLNDVPTSLGPVAVQPGETWNFQAWYRDQNPGSTSNFSDGLSVRFD